VFIVNFKIFGNNLQIVKIMMEKGDKIYAEAGALVMLFGNIDMKAKARGGLLKSLGRKLLTGETFFLTEYKAHGDGYAGFAGNVPGTIYPIDTEMDGTWLAQRDAFLVAEDSVEIKVAFQKKLGSIFFGGEGLILQKYEGKGKVFIHASGDFMEIVLEKGEKLKVDTGSAVAWEESVDYDISRVKGVGSMLFGGEGLFMTELTGPGKVLIQSMNIRELAMALSPFMAMRGQSSGNSGGIVGNIINNSFN
jgi:uncharacterized protein (TIGR00266 family)